MHGRIFQDAACAHPQQEYTTRPAEASKAHFAAHPQMYGGNSYLGSSYDEVEDSSELSCRELPSLSNYFLVESEDSDSLTDKGSDPSLPNSPIATIMKRARSHDVLEQALALKELQAEVRHSSVEQLYEAATILNQMQHFDVQSTDLHDVDALVQGCLRTRLFLWAKYRGVFVDSRGESHLSKLIEDERDLIQQHEDIQKWIEQDMQLNPFLNFLPMKKRAKCGKNSVDESTFVPVPASALCVGCVVMVRRDFRIGTIIRERKGGWRIVQFDDDSTGCFQPFDLRKLHDPEDANGQKKTTNHDCIGQVVCTNKSDCRDEKQGVVVAEKSGGWRIVEHEDGTRATYHDTELDVVKSEATKSKGAEPKTRPVSYPSCSNDANAAKMDQHVDVMTDVVGGLGTMSTVPRKRKATELSKQTNTQARPTKRLEPCEYSGSSAATRAPTPDVCELSTIGPDAITVASLVGMKVWLKQNDEVGTIILEKNGGWKVVRFADGRKHTYRPGELYVPGMPANFLCAESRSIGPCMLFKQGQRVFVPKHNSQAVIIEEKAGGWRVVEFPDGQIASFRPGEIEIASGDRSDTPTSSQSPTSECSRVDPVTVSQSPCAQVLEVVTVKRTGQKGTVVCEKSGGWRVVEFEDESRITFRAGDLDFCEHVYGYGPKPTLTVARPRSVSVCTSLASTCGDSGVCC